MTEHTFTTSATPLRSALPGSHARAGRGRYLPLWLSLFCAIPVGAGIVRLHELASGAAITPDNARFLAAPLPIVLHIVCASAFALLGAFQFSTWFRRRWPRWHRRLGWGLVPCGMVAAATGLFMQLSPALPEHDRGLLTVFRLLFGAGMMVSLALGSVALVRRDFVTHGAWMLRAYAIALGAGTQSLLIFPWFLAFGLPSPLTSALVMGASWLVNLLAAEQILRRAAHRRSGGARSRRAVSEAQMHLS